MRQQSLTNLPSHHPQSGSDRESSDQTASSASHTSCERTGMLAHERVGGRKRQRREPFPSTTLPSTPNEPEAPVPRSGGCGGERFPSATRPSPSAVGHCKRLQFRSSRVAVQEGSSEHDEKRAPLQATPPYAAAVSPAESRPPLSERSTLAIPVARTPTLHALAAGPAIATDVRSSNSRDRQHHQELR